MPVFCEFGAFYYLIHFKTDNDLLITYEVFKQTLIKDKDYCLMEIIKGLTDKGQFQYLTKLMGPQEGTYLYGTQFHSLR